MSVTIFIQSFADCCASVEPNSSLTALTKAANSFSAIYNIDVRNEDLKFKMQRRHCLTLLSSLAESAEGGIFRRRSKLRNQSRELTCETFLALYNPGHHGKQEACGQPAHQDSNEQFYRT